MATSNGQEDFGGSSGNNQYVEAPLNGEEDNDTDDEDLQSSRACAPTNAVENEMSSTASVSKSIVNGNDAIAQEINMTEQSQIANLEVRVVLEHLVVNQDEMRREEEDQEEDTMPIAYMTDSSDEEKEEPVRKPKRSRMAVKKIHLFIGSLLCMWQKVH